MTGLLSLALQPQLPTRFARAKYFSESLREEQSRFVSLFHRYAYIFKPISGGNWISSKPEWKLTDSEILKAIAGVHPKFFLGCRAARATRFAVLDIDAGSKYRTPESICAIMTLLAEAGLSQTHLYRSSDSGGLHLYIFFDEPISCRDLRRQLSALLKHHDYDIAKGTLEVFPHTTDDSLGQGLRLPLQPGWAWINPLTLEPIDERSDMSAEQALRQFLRDLDCGNTHHDFHQLKAYVDQLQSIPTRSRKSTENKPRTSLNNVVSIRNSVCSESEAQVILSSFGCFPPGLDGRVWAKGREYFVDGLTAPHQRADAIFCLGHYLFYGDPERCVQPLGYGYKDERRKLIEHVLTTKHNECSRDLSRRTKDSLEQVDRATAWLPQSRREGNAARFSNDVPVSWKRNNFNRLLLARKKITAAVQDLEENAVPFSMRDLQLKSGCSATTLYKHQDLWKPTKERLENERLASVTHVFNAVEAVGPQKTHPPATCSKIDMPPGRLAARRIIYELQMREERQQKDKAKMRLDFSENYAVTWQKQVSTALTDTLTKSSVAKLKFALNLYMHLLPRSPNEEEQLSLMERITAVRFEIAARSGAPTSLLSADGLPLEGDRDLSPSERSFERPLTDSLAGDRIEAPAGTWKECFDNRL